MSPARGRRINLAKRIEIKFRRIRRGQFIYQGEKAIVNSFGIAETPFTIGQMEHLLRITGYGMRDIFKDPEWKIDRIISKSKGAVAADVAWAEIKNCPLVYINYFEAAAVARLLGKRLLLDKEWERAAAGKRGMGHPWGDGLSEELAVYKDIGTRPVGSKPDGVNEKEKVYDLIGNVSEWVQREGKDAWLRGGSWDLCNPGDLLAVSRLIAYPGHRNDFIGFRLGED